MPPLALTGLTLALVWLCWLLTAPFVSGFTWGLALAVALLPLRERLGRRMPDWLATLLILIALVTALIIPGMLFARELYQQSLIANDYVREVAGNIVWKAEIHSRPWLASFVGWINAQFDPGQLTQQLASMVASSVAPLLSGSIGVVSQAGVIFLVLYFLLEDSEAAIEGLRNVLPLTSAETDTILTRLADTIRATIYGRLGIGTLQGCLGGLIFAIVGLPGAMFWGALMIILSMLPIFGAFLVWVPAAIVLAVQGHWIKGLIVLGWGLVVIHPVDNILYPVMVGAKTGLHPLLLFVGFVGGLAVFGPAGLILGPCIIAATLAVFGIWHARMSLSGDKA